MLVNLIVSPPTALTTTTNISCNGNQYKVQLPKSQLFQIVENIAIPGKFETLIELLVSNSKKQYTIPEAVSLIENGKRYFDRKIEIDIFEASMSMILGEELKKQQLQQLDLLSLPQVLSMFKHGYDVLSNDLSFKVSRKLGLYIEITKRKQSEKNTLILIKQNGKNTKEIQKNSKEIQKNSKEIQKNSKEIQKNNNTKESQILEIKDQQKANTVQPDDNQWIEVKKKKKGQRQIKGDKYLKGQQKKGKEKDDKKKQSQNKNSEAKTITAQQISSQDVEIPQQKQKNNPRGGNRRQRRSKQNQGNYKRNYDSKSNNKQKRSNGDQKIGLGIRGDTESGWRQRLRPTKMNSMKNDEVQSPNPNKYKGKIEGNTKNKVDDKNITKIKASQFSENKKSFIFPNDGSSFKFEANKNYTILINSCLEINIKDNEIIIKNGEKGYIRKGVIEPLPNSKGFIANGITIMMDGLSNIQDGGQQFGNPTVQQISPNGKAFFKLEKMEILSQ